MHPYVLRLRLIWMHNGPRYKPGSEFHKIMRQSLAGESRGNVTGELGIDERKSGGAHGQDAAAGVSGRLEMPATILSRENIAASDAAGEALRGSLGVPGTPAVPLGSSPGRKEADPAAAGPTGSALSPREGDLSATFARSGDRAK
jgi:hypothetical protein